MAYETRRFNTTFKRVSSTIPILSWINTIPRIYTYLFKIHSNIVLAYSLCLDLPKVFYPVILPFRTFLNSGYITWSSQSSGLNHPGYIRWTVQTMKFLIVEYSPIWWLFSLQAFSSQWRTWCHINQKKEHYTLIISGRFNLWEWISL